MNTYTIKLTNQQIIQLKQRLRDAKVCKTPPYALYQIKTSDTTITAYESLKVVFQGEGASYFASVYDTQNTQATSTSSSTLHATTYPQCGSDEVGTGDYFGPVIVCALCIQPQDLTLVQSLPIADSKQIKDADILKIAPALMHQLNYSLLVLENKKYNIVHQTNNMNAIKAKLHNQAFLHLQNKLQTPLQNVIVDQFTTPKSYFKYLQNESQIFQDIHFETKAESKYLSVACASIIARYHFLQAMDQLSARYDFTFLKGASSKVDESGVAFVKRFGEQQLQHVCKLHFKNTQKIIEALKQ